MNAMSYEGWEIQVRYYLSCMGDVDPQVYESQLKTKIDSYYPGASIEIVSLPDGVGNPAEVYSPDGRDTQGAVYVIEELMEDVFEDICNGLAD